MFSGGLGEYGMGLCILGYNVNAVVLLWYCFLVLFIL